MPEEQSVHARDGVDDPHGCGNPLRSGIAGLATAPDSQLPATHFPDPPLRPQTSRPSPQSDTQIPTRKACCARRAKRPRQGWRGRSARMRESFAIGHCGSFDGSRLTATSHFPDLPLTPQTPRPFPQSDTQIPTRKACCARRAKRPRQGWRGRSAWMRESFAIGHSRPFVGSRLTATSHQPSATHFPDPPLRPQTPRPSPQSDTQIQQERPAVPEEQSVHARDGVADPHGCGNPLRSGTAGLSAAPDSQPSASSHPP